MEKVRKLKFRVATNADIATMIDLINSAYRGESSRLGWTTEADLVAGDRVSVAEVASIVDSENSVIVLCLDAGEIIGTVELRQEPENAYLGMFVIKPSLQGAGLGKRLLQQAEDFVRDNWCATSICMSVISVRDELIAFYERRGYQRTGIFEDFPEEIGQSSPLISGLKFENLRKDLS